MPSAPKAPTPKAPEIKIGDVVLDRYRVVEQIGSGGHSVVYRGQDERLSRPVCIKMFSGLGGDSGVGRTSYEHFVQEAFALSRLTHPNTLRIYDFGHLGLEGQRAGMPLQVCEYMNGGTLSNIIREQGKQTLAETVRVIGAMCAALSEAHALGIVHRDIKPQNILFGSVGTNKLPKLADFGIAKWSADERAGQGAARRGHRDRRRPEARDVLAELGRARAARRSAGVAGDGHLLARVRRDLHAVGQGDLRRRGRLRRLQEAPPRRRARPRRARCRSASRKQRDRRAHRARSRSIRRSGCRRSTSCRPSSRPRSSRRPRSDARSPPPPRQERRADAASEPSRRRRRSISARRTPRRCRQTPPRDPAPRPPREPPMEPLRRVRPTIACAPTAADVPGSPRSRPRRAADLTPQTYYAPTGVQAWMQVAPHRVDRHARRLALIGRAAAGRRPPRALRDGRRTSTVDLVGLHGTKVRITLVPGPTGNRVVHVKGMTCFVAHARRAALAGGPDRPLERHRPRDPARAGDRPHPGRPGHARPGRQPRFSVGDRARQRRHRGLCGPDPVRLRSRIRRIFRVHSGTYGAQVRRDAGSSYARHGSHSARAGPPRAQNAVPGPPIGEDYADFEGDPTNINQIPHVRAQPRSHPRSSRHSRRSRRRTPPQSSRIGHRRSSRTWAAAAAAACTAGAHVGR